MKSIKNTWIHPVSKVEIEFEFFPADNFDFLKNQNIKVNHASGFCFWNGKLLIVKNGESNRWSLAGGGIEANETYDEAMIREAKEEGNVKILKLIPLGYQSVKEKGQEIIHQTRYSCLVEPYGEFVSDPGVDITEIKWINPRDYKKYFDWGGTGDYLLERALEAAEL
jgi:8-oxo-dGTP diphosphatase